MAEQYVSAFSNLAKESNTILLPSNTGDITGMVTQVLHMQYILQYKLTTSRLRINVVFAVVSDYINGCRHFPAPQAMTIYGKLAKASPVAATEEVVEEKIEDFQNQSTSTQ